MCAAGILPHPQRHQPHTPCIHLGKGTIVHESSAQAGPSAPHLSCQGRTTQGATIYNCCHAPACTAVHAVATSPLGTQLPEQVDASRRFGRGTPPAASWSAHSHPQPVQAPACKRVGLDAVVCGEEDRTAAVPASRLAHTCTSVPLLLTRAMPYVRCRVQYT